jgi:hypothetical protein
MSETPISPLRARMIEHIEWSNVLPYLMLPRSRKPLDVLSIASSKLML